MLIVIILNVVGLLTVSIDISFSQIAQQASLCGPTTISITPLSILVITLTSITYAYYHIFIAMLSIIKPSVVMLSVVVSSHLTIDAGGNNELG